VSSEGGLDVGFLCQGWFPQGGGIESHTFDLASELLARGHRVHVLCLDPREGRAPYSVETQSEPLGTGEVEVRRMAYRYHDHRALADLVANERADDVVLAWMAETPCDVIHAHHLTGFGAGALRAVSDMGRPLVMTLHDFWMLCPRGQMLRADGVVCDAVEASVCGQCLARTWPHLMPPGAANAEAAAMRTRFALEMLALPQRLLTPSRAALEQFAALGIPRERLRVVEHGIDGEGLARETTALGRGSAGGEVRLGVLGSVQPSKAVLELMRAVLAADVPGLTLEIHGGLPSYHGDSSYVDAVRALAATDARLRLRGPYERRELPRILAELDGVAAPSRWREIYGLTAREARAVGLPVLASDRGGLREAAEGDEGVTLVPPDDRAAWIEALRRFASRARERAGAPRIPRAVRSRREMALELERIYLEVIAEAG
jgi:glycosyltransferase involved in cell wall biosynthesis